MCIRDSKCLPIRGDVFKFIKNGREQFDFIFADPPYACLLYTSYQPTLEQEIAVKSLSEFLLSTLADEVFILRG